MGIGRARQCIRAIFCIATCVALTTAASAESPEVSETTGTSEQVLNPEVSEAPGVQSMVAAPVEQAPAQGSTEEQLQEITQGHPIKIQEEWTKVFRAAQAGELKGVNDGVIELERLRTEAGIDSLENISVYFVERGLEALGNKDIETAAFYARKALQLSPNSPRVLLRSLYLADTTRTAPLASQFSKACMELLHQPHLLLEALKTLVYPMLWSLTIGLYVAYLLCFGLRIHVIMRGAARRIPTGLRGIATPLFVLAMLILPCMVGPLWTLVAWSGVMYAFLPKKRWLGFCAGAILALWGLLIPLRENLGAWFDDPGIQTMLKVSSGTFDRSDKQILQMLTQARPNDGVALFTLAQLLRKYEEFDEAEKNFSIAERELGNQPWTRAQRGMLAFMRGDLEQADKLMTEAEELGLSSAEFYFNFSKVKFELLDTEQSRELFRKAAEADSDLAVELREREEQLGMRNNFSLAEVRLPVNRILASALIPIDVAMTSQAKVAELVMPGMSAWAICGIGIILLAMFFWLPVQPRTTRVQTYYAEYRPARLLVALLRVLPGGAWVVVGKPAVCFGVISIGLLLCMPLAGWPAGSNQLLDIHPHVAAYYAYGLGLLAIAIVIFGFQLGEEK